MKTSPQPLWANIFLVVSVIITMFLANNAILQKLFGSLFIKYVENVAATRLGIAFGAAFVEITIVAVCTSLGRDLLRSFKQSKISACCYKPLSEQEEESADKRFSKV